MENLNILIKKKKSASVYPEKKRVLCQEWTERKGKNRAILANTSICVWGGKSMPVAQGGGPGRKKKEND